MTTRGHGRATRVLGIVLALMSTRSAAGQSRSNPNEYLSTKSIDDVEKIAKQATQEAKQAREAASEARDQAARSLSEADVRAAAAENAARDAQGSAAIASRAASDAVAGARVASDAALRTAQLSSDLESKRQAMFEQWLATLTSVANAEIAAWNAIEDAATHPRPPPTPADQDQLASSISRMSGNVTVQQANAAAAREGGRELSLVTAQLGEIANTRASYDEQIKRAVADLNAARAMKDIWSERKEKGRSRKERDEAAEKVVQMEAEIGKLDARKDALNIALSDLERSERDTKLRRDYLKAIIGSGARWIAIFLIAALVCLYFAVRIAGRNPRVLPPGPPLSSAGQRLYSAMPRIIGWCLGLTIFVVLIDAAVTCGLMWDSWEKAMELWRPREPDLLRPEEFFKDLLASHAWKSAVASLPFAGVAALLHKLGVRGDATSAEASAAAGREEAPASAPEARTGVAVRIYPCNGDGEGCRALQEFKRGMAKEPTA